MTPVKTQQGKCGKERTEKARVRSRQYKPKVRNCGIISSGLTTGFGDENLSLSENSAGQKSLSVFSSQNVNTQNRSPQRSSKLTSHQVWLQLTHSAAQTGS